METIMERQQSGMRAPILAARGGPSTPEKNNLDGHSPSSASTRMDSMKSKGAWSSSSGSSTPPGSLTPDIESPQKPEALPSLPVERRESSTSTFSEPDLVQAAKVEVDLEASHRFSGASTTTTTDVAADVRSDIAVDVRSVSSNSSAVNEAPGGRVYWEGFVVNMPMFCGYAALFGLQHEVKTRFGIKDSNSPESFEFGFACSFLYIFNLMFRFLHNVVFGSISPFGRTLIAMTSMITAMTILAVPICILEDYQMHWVYLAYAFGGVAVGTFEGNLLCCLTPLGHRTKHITITAIPVGITTVLVGGFLLMGPPFYFSVTTLYMGVAFGILLGMVTFATRIPRNTTVEQPNLKRFALEAKAWRQWLPKMWHYPLATAVDMFTLSAFSPGVALYIWDQKTVTIMAGLTMPTDTFFALYNTANMAGGLLGRILSYQMRPRHPLCYTVFNVVGASMLLLKMPLLAPLSTFLVMIGDGLIYGAIARHIDTNIPKEFNLIAISFWLFVGDFGSVLGSNLISYIREWVMGF